MLGCFRYLVADIRLQGLEADLGMSIPNNDYNLALCVFFITYLCIRRCHQLIRQIYSF